MLGDGAADGALGDVVAGADDGVVGQRGRAELRGGSGTGGQDEGLGGERGHRAGEGAQGAVGVGVADEDAAEEGAVAADDELLVEAGAGVGVDDVETVLGGAVRVAEGGDVHAEQLELGGEVGAGERALLGVVGGDGRGGRLGLLVAGRHQPVDPSVGGERALADGEDMRVGDGAALFVDADAAAFADGQPAVPGELVAGADAGAEHDEVRGQFGAVGQLHAGDGAGVVGDDLLGADARVDGEPHVLDGAQQRGAAAVVDLDGHQTGRELHDVGVQAEPLERAGRLQAEQPAADDGAGGGAALRVLLDGEQVLDGPVDEAALGVLAGDRRDEGGGAGGQDEGVVGERQTGAGGDGAGRAVDAHGRVAEAQFDAVFGEERGVGEGQLLGGAAGEVGGELDAVVGGAGFLAEHDHAVRGGEPACGERLEEALADHAVADEHERGGGPGGGGHQEPPSLVSRWSRGVPSGSGSAPSQARASAPTVPSSPTRTPPTTRSPRTTTLR